MALSNLAGWTEDKAASMKLIHNVRRMWYNLCNIRIL